MSKKTNKTSHVMDLLTNGASTDTDSPVTEAVSNQEKKPADVQSHTVTPAKVTVVDEGSRNDRLSQEILGKLTEELEQEARQETAGSLNTETTDSQDGDLTAVAPPDSQPADPAVPDESQSQNPSDPDNSQNQNSADPDESQNQNSADSPNESPVDASDSPGTEAAGSADGSDDDFGESSPIQEKAADMPKVKAVSPQKEPHPIIPESQFNSRFQDKEYRFINVMEQLLMRQNLEAVLTQYDVCTCPRCMSDVCALVLTGLPAKYVVTSRDSISPLISYYENKYKIPVLTELMKACDRVRQNPRHKVSN